MDEASDDGGLGVVLLLLLLLLLACGDELAVTLIIQSTISGNLA